MELSCSRGEGGLSQTVEEKKKHGLKRDRVHYAAETAEHKETCKPRTKDRARRAVCAAAEAYLFKALILLVDTVKKWSTSTNILAVYSHT